MNNKQEYWYNRGYDEQKWSYPLLYHVWGRFSFKYPKKYQKYYRQGQIEAYRQGAEKPWFFYVPQSRR